MPNFANATLAAPKQGINYAQSSLLPALEGDLYNGVGGDPVQVIWHEAIAAAVELSAAGSPAGTAYVILQGDFGDGTWFDLAWALWNVSSGGANFFLGSGFGGACVFQQTRNKGTAPGANGFNASPAPCRYRFVGQSSMGTSSTQVKANIVYRLQSLR